MAGIARMDHEDNINVILAHDTTLDSVLEKLSADSAATFVRLSGTTDEHQHFKQRSRV
jgi:hypothetical protein